MSQPTGYDPTTARQWLGVLHGNSPGHLLVCSTDDWAGRAFTPAQLDQAAAYITGLDAVGKEGIYLRVTSVTAPPAAGKRGSAADSAALPALWADLDLAGPGHKEEGDLPPDEDAGRAVIAASGLPEPTIWVHSGGGLYPIWLLNELYLIDASNLDDAKRLAKDWQRVIEHAAASLGWRYGRGVGDLARVLRIPGTVNRKAGLARPCRILSAGAYRYTYRHLVDALDQAIARITPAEPVNLSHPAPALQLGHVDRPAGAISPLDDYAGRTDWADILVPAGWREHYRQDDVTYWTRPGKTTGTSASTNALGTNRLHVFTTSAAPLDGGESYSKGGCYAALYHGGDHSAAARELAGAGYGTPLPDPGVAHREALTDILGAPPPDPPPRDDEQTGGELPSPNQPLDVARQLVHRMSSPYAWWRGDFYLWAGTHWDAIEDSAVQNWLYRQTERAVYTYVDGNGDSKTKLWAPTKKKITDLTHALGVGAVHRQGEADKAIAVTNGVLDIRAKDLLQHSRDRFNLFSLPFAYDPDADAPAWATFLNSVLPDDQQAQEFLGEWFGYVLSGRTEQQKMAALIGPRRSGKGTIGRVLTAMLGQPNVAGLDLNHLPGQFGLENLINKALAIAGDVRWHSRNIGDAVPLLLRVIGEDVMDVHRKNRSTWNGQLPSRIMMMSNDTPTFSDHSGALAGRMIFVKFDESFYGREDSSLTDKLLHELPGILNWALQGLERLNGRRRFTEPASAQNEANEVRRLSDPVGAFIEDWCEIDSDNHISLDVLYQVYKSWCQSEGRTKDSTTKSIFSRDLRRKVPKLVVKRERSSGKQVQNLYGITSQVSAGMSDRWW